MIIIVSLWRKFVFTHFLPYALSHTSPRAPSVFRIFRYYVVLYITSLFDFHTLLSSKLFTFTFIYILLLPPQSLHL
jgi:hypothetical protein